MAKVSSPPTSEPLSPAREPAKTSPVRLMVLIGLFFLVVGLLGYDFLVAKPAAKKAHDEIEIMFSKRNAQGVRKSDTDKIEVDFVKPADVQKLIGKTPMWTKEGTEKGKEYYMECYWWGTMPHRNYLWVMYHGPKDNLRFNSQHPDSSPETEDYPGTTELETSPPKKNPGETGEPSTGTPPTVPPKGEPPGPEKTNPTNTDPDKPAPPKPEGDTPAEPKPTEPAPTEPKPAPAEPTPTEPKPAEPKPAEPKATEPAPAEPKSAEPAPAEPKAATPTADAPAAAP